MSCFFAELKKNKQTKKIHKRDADYQTCTHLFSPRNIQGNKSGKYSWLSKKLTSHVRGKLFVITDVQVL